MGRPKLPDIHRNCLQCGKDFVVCRTNKKQKFHDNECKWEFLRKRPDPRACVQCGDLFTPRGDWDKSKTCGPSCGAAWKKNQVSITNCLYCGKEIEQCKQGRKKKFCPGGECCRQYKVQQEKAKPHTVKICPLCDSEFIDATANRYKKYCNFCRNRGISTSVIRKCRQCGTDVFSRPDQPQDFCNPEHFYEYRNNHPEEFSKPVGHRRMQGGYWKVKIGTGKWMDEHRYVMEMVIGRPLRKDEVVHHKNGDPLDNRPENLMVTSHSQHRKIHYEIEKLGFMLLMDDVNEDFLMEMRKKYAPPSAATTARPITLEWDALVRPAI